MSLPKINPVNTDAWKKLIAHKDIVNKKSLKENKEVVGGAFDLRFKTTKMRNFSS